MPSLHDIQRGFAAAIRDPEAAPRFAPLVQDGDLSAERRLRLYRNNHVASLSDALAAVYPVVLSLVGEPCFRQCARQYLAAHPSRSGDIHDYGEHLGDLLERLPQVAGHPYLGDLARLEWAYHAVFQSRREVPLDLAALGAVAPADYPRLRFLFQPALRLIDSAYPVLQIWRLHQPDWAGEETLRLEAGGERVLVTRAEREVVLAPLGVGEHALLQALAEGHALAEAVGRAQSLEPGCDPGPILRRQVALATLVGWRL